MVALISLKLENCGSLKSVVFSDIMRHKYILLLFYLFLLNVGFCQEAETDKTPRKKSSEVDDEKISSAEDSATLADKLREDQDDELASYERLRAHVIKIVEAPDLSKSEESEAKEIDEEDNGDEEFKIFFKSQKKLLRRMTEQVQADGDQVEVSDVSKPEEPEKKEILDEEENADEAFKMFFKKQKKLLRRMIAQVQGYADGGDGGVVELEGEDDGEFPIDVQFTPTEPPLQPPELTPQERAGRKIHMTHQFPVHC